VLKINITESPEEQRWSLEGCLVSDWATELGTTWKRLHGAGDTRRCVVELTDVTFIGRSGEAVLAEMMGQGAEFIARDVYTKHLLLKLRGQQRRNRAGPQ
jgi:hypothetical protein